jgi:hypothetical protein
MKGPNLNFLKNKFLALGLVVYASVIFLIIGGCNVDEENNPAANSNIEISGNWQDDFGGNYTIDNSVWNIDGSYITKSAIIKFDNSGNYAITQYSADDLYNPNEFNKIVWTEIQNNSFYSCTVVYGKISAAEAESTTLTADSNNLSNGCDGFQWTLMNRAIPK